MNQTSAQRGTDLSAVFDVVTQALAANQASLNQADMQNQNHGDNMVQAFNMIAQSMPGQRGTAPSHELQHATSGSGQIYAQGCGGCLARAHLRYVAATVAEVNAGKSSDPSQ